MKSRTWLIIGVILIGIIVASAYVMQSSDDIGITVNTNGTNPNIQISSLFFTPPQMKSEMELHAYQQVYESNSTR